MTRAATDAAQSAFLDATVRRRIDADRSTLATAPQIGAGTHDTSSPAFADNVTAGERGAHRVDLALFGQGPGTWMDLTEAFVAVVEPSSRHSDCVRFALDDVAADVIHPPRLEPVQVDHRTWMLRSARVYLSLLLHVERASRRFGLDSCSTLRGVGGRRDIVGGQGDMVISIAASMQQKAQTQFRTTETVSIP
ncbi:hypothetical protein [Nocardia sp. CA-290969]|uniref:hypothetical protein n=1 Tax=Nocardia sp. CA-290969 TaxID=3239986 RepID=UPI003D92B95C